MRVVVEPEIKPHDPELYQSDRETTKVPGFEAVDEAALEQYNEQGFLVIAGGLSDTVVQAARTTLKAMTESDAPRCSEVYYEGSIRNYMQVARAEQQAVDGNLKFESLAMGEIRDQLPSVPTAVRSRYVRKFQGFTHHYPALYDVAYDPAMLRAIELLVGEKVRMFQDMAMIKPPGGREKPWHQDHAYFNLPLDTRICGVWIALDTVTPENGCMYLLAGAHKDGPRTHFMRRDWQICDVEMRGCQPTCAPMNPGDVLLFDAKLPHGTPTNRTDQWRWAIQLHYVPERVAPIDEKVRLEAFGNEGKNVTC